MAERKKSPLDLLDLTFVGFGLNLLMKVALGSCTDSPSPSSSGMSGTTIDGSIACVAGVIGPLLSGPDDDPDDGPERESTESPIVKIPNALFTGLISRKCEGTFLATCGWSTTGLAKT